jgi:hypothetical protein
MHALKTLSNLREKGLEDSERIVEIQRRIKTGLKQRKRFKINANSKQP